MSKTSFCATSQKDQREMLQFLGCESFDELFSGLPADLQAANYDLSPALSEMEMMLKVRRLADKNRSRLVNFCGAGFYDHFIPAAVDSLAGRSEFYTAYTPYQPEVSQGTLQAAYEFQTAMARLTGMDCANASLYDGGTALFEAIMMALRCTRRNKILVDEGINPIYRSMIKCYTGNLSIKCKEIPLAANGLVDRVAVEKELDDDVAAVLLQNPNFFGCLDDFSDLIEKIHGVKALAIASVYPVSLAIVKTPAEMGADIVVGEGQSLGIPLSFGGPYLGFMATRKKYLRKMPGRIVGATVDSHDRRGFVLTLQAREQHIRREKATSNICTNVQLCALRAIIHLSLLGKEGLVDTARRNMERAGYAAERLQTIEGVDLLFDQPFFNEFAIRLSRPARDVVSALLEEGVAGGFPAGRYYEGLNEVLLLAFTEKRTKREIDEFVAKLEHVLNQP